MNNKIYEPFTYQHVLRVCGTPVTSLIRTQMGWQRVTLSTRFFVVYGRWYYRGKGLVNHTLTTIWLKFRLKLVLIIFHVDIFGGGMFVVAASSSCGSGVVGVTVADVVRCELG